MTQASDRPQTTRAPLPVDRIRPAYEQVANQLRELIVQGGLAPGTRLPVEADLAASFGVSRGTVREALRVLSSRDLIYAVRGSGGGTFVSESDPATVSEYLETGIELLSADGSITLDELLEARKLLEVPVARFAAERRSEESLAELQAALDAEMASSGSARSEHHHRFHLLLLAAAGNGLLDLMTQPVFGVIRSRYVLQPNQGRREVWEQVDSDHATILEHVARGDGAGAARAMEEHLLRLDAVYRATEAARSDAEGAEPAMVGTEPTALRSAASSDSARTDGA